MTRYLHTNVRCVFMELFRELNEDIHLKPYSMISPLKPCGTTFDSLVSLSHAITYSESLVSFSQASTQRNCRKIVL